MNSPSDFDYSRPQTWRNMPQQQERVKNSGHLPIYEMDHPVHGIGRSSSNLGAASVHSTEQSLMNSDLTNASVAATAIARGVTNANKRTESVSSVTSSATRKSVDTAVETMWEARRTREKAEEEADQKLLDAVCKASLAEFTQRERALNDYESEITQRSLEHKTSSTALQHAKSDAVQRKFVAIQTVIDSKSRARHMSEKAREATSLYAQKNEERLARKIELEAIKLREMQETEMLEVQMRKEEAMHKRTEAEQRAREARDNAEAMRRQAFLAASKVRANSRRQIETQLGEEEAQRRHDMQRKLDEIENNKDLAHQKMETATKKAENARRRAEELCLKAEHARAGLKSSTTTASTFSAH